MKMPHYVINIYFSFFQFHLICIEWTGGEWTGGEWTGGEWTGGEWTGGEWTGGEWTGGECYLLI